MELWRLLTDQEKPCRPRTSDYESEGRTFESFRARHRLKGPFRTHGLRFTLKIVAPDCLVWIIATGRAARATHRSQADQPHGVQIGRSRVNLPRIA